MCFSEIVFCFAQFSDGKCGPLSLPLKATRHCPVSCESHFLGAKRTCYRLPKGLGCKCAAGYVRDNHTCVHPRRCKCLKKCECFSRLSAPSYEFRQNRMERRDQANFIFGRSMFLKLYLLESPEHRN